MSLIPPALESTSASAAPLTATTAPHVTPRRVGRRLLRGLLVLLALAWSLLLIAWLTLHWGILPHIQEWRDRVEAGASRALGVPVRIGVMDVRSGGWMPSFELKDVTLQGADGRIALRLPRVVAAVSARSLLSFELDFEQLLIEGAELELRRAANGHVFVGGLDLGDPGGGSADASHAAADWFFRQREFVIRGGSVRWVDAQRMAPPLVLGQVELVMRNTLRQHAWRLDATPPAGWGERFSLSGRFTQPLLARRGDWQRWSGSGYASLPRADVGLLGRYVTLPFELSEGRGALRAWFEFEHGEPTAATVDVALTEVALRLARNVQAMAFSRVEGRLIGRRDKEGMSLQARRFSFDTDDGVRWPEGGLTLAWRQRAGQAATGGSFTAEHLDLGLMARIATRIPLVEAARALMDDVRPQGTASEVDAQWEGALDAPAHYRVKASLSGLALAARPAAEVGGIGRPGLRNASLQLDANDTGGSARMDLAHGALELPGVFEEPLLPLDRLAARVLWKIEPAAGLSVQLKEVRFANADAHGEFDARWSRHADDPLGRLELDGTLADGAATRVHRYLPLALSRPIRDYVERAVQGGRLTSASYHVHGELRDFPFFDAGRSGGKGGMATGGGDFRILAKARDLSFAYVPGTEGAPSPWPMLTGASAELALDRGRLQVRDGHARIGGIDFDRVGGAIEQLESGGVLNLGFVARGPLADMLGFVDASPVGGWIGQALARATATGTSELKLALGLPLRHLATSSTVKGSLVLHDNDLQFTPDSPLLARARGAIDFTEKGFDLKATSAKIYGGETTLEGGTQADGSLRFAGQGTVSAEGLRQAPELGPLAKLAAAFAGQTSYRATLGYAHGHSELDLGSPLVGMAIDLPAPLAKAAETPLAMRYRTTVEPRVASAAPRDALQFDLGDAVQARYVRDLSGDSPRVLRGGVGVFAAAPVPAHGVAAKVELKALDVDAWQTAVDRLFGAPAAAMPAAGMAPSPEAVDDSGYLPDRVALRVQGLSVSGRKFSHLTASVSREQAAWRARLDADELAGDVEYRAPSRASVSAVGGRVFARLSRLSLLDTPPGPCCTQPAPQAGSSRVAEPYLLETDARQVTDLFDSPPAQMPALDVVVDDFVLNGMNLGRVEVEASSRSAGPVRDPHPDWQLTKFDITTPEAKLVGTGLWAATGAPLPRTAGSPRRMGMDFVLQIADGGALLTRLGMANVIRGGKGQLSGEVAWLGSPFSPDYPSLAGQVKVEIDEGQFLKVEPGAARLLGVLSLQSLPRRLSLDFRDVFAKGFAFDAITGDLAIAGGVAQTRNLQMRGVQAAVSMQGRADIDKETQDLRVVVVPEVNAGTAALAYAVINPVIGLGAFVAQALLKKPLTEAGTREFRVSGPWADPKVVQVARTPAAGASAAHPAASAPGSNP